MQLKREAGQNAEARREAEVRRGKRDGGPGL